MLKKVFESEEKAMAWINSESNPVNYERWIAKRPDKKWLAIIFEK